MHWFSRPMCIQCLFVLMSYLLSCQGIVQGQHLISKVRVYHHHYAPPHHLISTAQQGYIGRQYPLAHLRFATPSQAHTTINTPIGGNTCLHGILYGHHLSHGAPNGRQPNQLWRLHHCYMNVNQHKGI